MADKYSITGQTYENVRQPDGTYLPMVTVKFTTKTDPPVAGSVSVPQSLLRDKVKYAETVGAEIEQAVGAHEAVAGL